MMKELFEMFVYNVMLGVYYMRPGELLVHKRTLMLRNKEIDAK